MVTEEILVEGHIIDSLILSKILDEILQFGGDFRLKQVDVGQKREDRSRAVIAVQAPSPDQLGQIHRYPADAIVPTAVPDPLVLAPARLTFSA
mgnify:CR=1 FL=1